MNIRDSGQPTTHLSGGEPRLQFLSCTGFCEVRSPIVCPEQRTLLAAPLQTHHVFCGLLAPSCLDDRWPPKMYSFRRASSESLGTRRDSSRLRPPCSYRCQASQGSRCLATDSRLSRLVSHRNKELLNCEHRNGLEGAHHLGTSAIPRLRTAHASLSQIAEGRAGR